jgi:hypothetical protein
MNETSYFDAAYFDAAKAKVFHPVHEENGWSSAPSVEAHMYSGPSMTLDNMSTSTIQVFQPGDWVVRWPNGTVSAISNHEFSSVYLK